MSWGGAAGTHKYNGYQTPYDLGPGRYGVQGQITRNPAGYQTSVGPGVVNAQPNPDGSFPFLDNPYIPFFGAPLKPEPPRREPRSHYDYFEAYDGTHSIHLSQYSIRTITEADTFWLRVRVRRVFRRRCCVRMCA